MKYKIFLWDFDGTVAYTSKDVWNSVEYAAGQWGGKLPKEFINEDSNLGKSVKEIFNMVSPYPGDDKYMEFEELVRDHYRYISEYEDTYLYKGIYELLKSNKQKNVVNYIITMKPKEALERILLKKRWESLFDGWLSPDSLDGCERTKSEMISHVLENTNNEKKEFVYIGDTWTDVVAAHENGIDCIGVTYGDGHIGLLKEKKPKYCVDSIFEIIKIIEEGE